MGSSHSKKTKWLENIHTQANRGNFSAFVDASMFTNDTPILEYLEDEGFTVRPSVFTYIVTWSNATEGIAKDKFDLAVGKIQQKMTHVASLGKKKLIGFPDYSRVKDHFVAQGLKCIHDDASLKFLGFSWEFSTTGLGLTLRQTAEQVKWDTVVPYLKQSLVEDGTRVSMPDHKLSGQQLKTLEKTDFIFFDSKTNEFVKKNRQ